MKADRAIEIVQNLADGVDPFSGERFASDSPYQQADTVRALHLALAGLTKLRRSTSRKSGPGRAWTDEEEQKLLQALDAKVDVEPIARAHDPLGRPEGLGIAGTDYEVEYAYDPLGRFGAVSVAGQAAQYRYVEGSDLLAGWTNSIPDTGLTRSYEPNRDLLTEVHNQAGGTVSQFAYQNDALGRRTERVDTYSGVVTNRFAYNARSEVTNALMGADSYAWAYDPIGNRRHYTENGTTLDYLVNQLNQYTNIANGVTHAPSYDDDGNMISYSGWTYQWSGENRLMLASNASTVASFAYDHMGRRIAKTVNGVETEFLYDGWNLVQETTGTNVIRYVWGLDLSQTLQGVGGVGGLLCVIENGEPYYPAYDANGNITEYVDSTGTTVAHYQYDAFGNTIAQSGPRADTFAHRFSTKYLDAETGLYYYGYRYYSPELGRWINRDPIGKAGGANVYGFANNFLPNLFDYLGFVAKGDPREIPKVGKKIRDCLSAGKYARDCLEKAGDFAGDPAKVREALEFIKNIQSIGREFERERDSATKWCVDLIAEHCLPPGALPHCQSWKAWETISDKYGDQLDAMEEMFKGIRSCAIMIKKLRSCVRPLRPL